MPIPISNLSETYSFLIIQPVSYQEQAINMSFLFTISAFSRQLCLPCISPSPQIALLWPLPEPVRLLALQLPPVVLAQRLLLRLCILARESHCEHSRYRRSLRPVPLVALFLVLSLGRGTLLPSGCYVVFLFTFALHCEVDLLVLLALQAPDAAEIELGNWRPSW